jgi:membrane protein implicated in regulation of membrane protease activity
MENFYLSPWFWLCLTVIFSIIEVLTSFALTTVWFAISALIMTVLSNTGLPFRFQVIIFLIVALVLLFLTRPIAIKKLNIGKEKTNVDSMVGRHFVLLKKITEFENGEIKINGVVWSAKSESGTAIEKGVKCVIIRIEGSHAVVAPLKEVNE